MSSFFRVAAGVDERVRVASSIRTETMFERGPERVPLPSNPTSFNPRRGTRASGVAPGGATPNWGPLPIHTCAQTC